VSLRGIDAANPLLYPPAAEHSAAGAMAAAQNRGDDAGARHWRPCPAARWHRQFGNWPIRGGCELPYLSLAETAGHERQWGVK